MRTVQLPLLCVGSLLALAALAVAQEEERDDFEAIEADAREHDRDVLLESGFVFIDGEFVPAPYRVTFSEDGKDVLVNGRVVPGAIPAPRFGTRPFDRQFRSRSGGRRGKSGENPGQSGPPHGMWAGRIRQHLDGDGAVVAFTDHRLEFLRAAQTYALLNSLLEPHNPESETLAVVLEIPSGSSAKAIWNEWLMEFQPRAVLGRQAEPFIAQFEASEAKNLASIAAVRRFEAVAYPLTLVGMLLSVVAFGHLLMSLPNNDAMRRGASEGGSGISSDVIRATMISVVLVAALSSLDLIWTLLASQAGQMMELNPIASHFINDPLSLIAFKASATILGCGLLYVLRRHNRAQLASWWMCLVCTMLTFRWLVFNSMFVT